MAEPPDAPSVSVLAAALHYARRGRRVVALRGKRPVTSRGACDGTTDPETIRRWFTGTGHNVGLCLDDLLVVDIDPRNHGDESWQDLIRQHSDPGTLVQQTGAGGFHYVFPSIATLVQGKPAPGLDVLTGPHRYIVAAPSRHPHTGSAYEWICKRPPAPAPGWLVDFIARERAPALLESATRSSDRAELLERARRYLSRCEPAISGQGGHVQTLRVALKIATRFRELENNDLLTALLEWNLLCRPPWTRVELQHKVRDAVRIVRAASGIS